MANEGQEPTVAAEGQDPTVTPDTDTNPTPPTAEGQAPKTFDEAYVKQLRSEAAATRTKFTAAEARAAEAEARATAAEERVAAIERESAKAAAVAALAAANVIDPDLAASVLAERIEIKDGKAANIDALVAEFVAARPAMVRASEPKPPALPETKPTNPTTAPNASRVRPAGRL